MPLTSAERQKRYRERLKEENPEKFKSQKKKNAERTKKNRKKIVEYAPSDQEIIRKEWRDRKNKNKKRKPEEGCSSKQTSGHDKSNYYRRVIYRLKNENEKQEQDIKKYKKSLKKMRQRLNRLIEKNNDLKEIVKEKKDIILSLEKKFNASTKIDEDIQQTSPLSKTCAYIDQNLPNICPEEKEKVKKVLLEHNVIMDTIKENYKSKNPQDKRLIKDILTKSDNINKYNLKTKLASYLGLKGKIRHTKQKNKSSLIQKMLKNFYERDDVSRMTAGKNEVKTQKKIKKQRRYLLGPLRKLYKKYREEGGKLSFSTFKRYRPFYILSPKAEKRETCACKRHENLLKKATALKSIGLIATTDLDELLSMVVCSSKSKECAYGECGLCKNKHIDFCMGEKSLNDNVSWDEWVLKSYEYQPKKNCNVIKTTKKNDMETKTGSLKMLIDGFQEELRNFKIHSYNILHQYKQYRQCKDNLDDRTVAVHIDFSENYACKLSTEIQAMHFDGSRQQINLHTGMLYTKKGHQSFASLSPNKDHGPNAIWAHLLPVLKEIKKKLPKVDGIHFYSDGPTVQYRQKKNFYYFAKLTKELGFPFSTWNFFESAHGKGAADGIGGAIKRKLDSIVAYGSNIPDAQTAFEFLQTSETKIQLFFIPDDDILSDSVELLPVPNTMKIHQIINNVGSANCIFYRYLSCFCQKSKNERPGFCNCLNLKPADLFKPLKIIGKKSVASRTPVTILTDIKNTEENHAYFDLSSYGPFNLKQIDIKTKIAGKSSKENSQPYHDKNKNSSKKRKIIDVHPKRNKKLKANVESSTDEDGTMSVHDTSDEDYHISSDEDYLDDMEMKVQENVKDLKKTLDKSKLEKKEIGQSSYDDETNIYTNIDTRGNISCNEKEGIVKTNFAEQSVIATTLQNDEKNFEITNNVSEVTPKIYIDTWRLSFKDSVLVRYYQRNSWKYYIGFLQDTFQKEGKSHFTIRFLKTVKKPELKFVVQKIKDEDTVTEDLIVKQIKITQNTERPKEYFLAEPNIDKFFFE